MMPTQNVATTVTLSAEREDGTRTVYKLAPGRSVLVGTSKDCGLRLQGQHLSSCHCLLSLEEGTLWVQDWASVSGTLLNGNAISAKVVMERDDELRVGEYRISAAFASSTPRGGWEEHEPPHTDSPIGTQEQPAEEASRDGSDSCDLPEEDALWAEGGLTAERSPEEAEYEHEAFEAESFEQETISLLREEVDALQGMLAQRDAQLAELSAGADRAGAICDVERDGEDSQALLARMEELLQEAACGDERVVLLEEMLQAAEEANQAEQEERHQLEAWVGDIERRITQRDDQRNAEVEALRERLDEAIEERERTQRQLQQAASVGNAPIYYEDSLNRLQHQNKSLQEKIAEMAAERATLMKRLESSASKHDEAMREERALIAQERAVVSRLRCELANRISELEDSPKPVNQAATEAATRLQALREHLREIHVEEQQENRGQQDVTLTSRIARIWKRLES